VIDWDDMMLPVLEQHRGWDTFRTAEHLRELYNYWGCELLRIDRTGFYGLWDTFKHDKDIKAEGIVWGGAPAEPKLYANQRSEAAFHLKESMRPGMSNNLRLSREQVKMLMEGSRIKRKTGAGRNEGKLVLASKEDMKRDGIKSTNYWDVVQLAFSRRVGKEAFKTATSRRHRMNGKCAVVYDNRTKTWSLELKDWPHFNVPGSQNPRPGRLARLIWYNTTGASAAVWVHMDRDETWTVFDCLLMKDGTPMEVFAADVVERSRIKQEGGVVVEHEYDVDSLSCPRSAEKPGDVHISHRFHDLILDHGGEELPTFISSSKFNNLEGMDALDTRLLSTLARDDEDEYWADGERDADNYLRPEQIYIAPECVRVSEEIEDARLKPPSQNVIDGEDGPQQAIGGGGPLVRCLRMLALSDI